jgi:carboxypeptidase A2
MTFDRYYRHDEINKYLDSLAAQHDVRTIGKSYEGREIKAIKLTSCDGEAKAKGGRNSIYIDAGIHAREWIAPATALYLIEQLTSGGDSSHILDKVDVIIQPVVNPDGYEYSHRLERLWRKTRSGILPATCRGTDGNRNFDYHWGEVGASPNQCSETFRGDKAFSEKETIALRDAVEAVKDSCKFYLTLHSYGNYMLYPWGYTSDLPESWRDIDEIARIGADAIANATGTKYTVGSSTNVLYAAAGGSDDYMFGAFDIPISITMELPGKRCD